MFYIICGIEYNGIIMVIGKIVFFFCLRAGMATLFTMLETTTFSYQKLLAVVINIPYYCSVIILLFCVNILIVLLLLFQYLLFYIQI